MNRLFRLLLPRTAWIFAVIILVICFAIEPAFQRPAYWVVLARNSFAAAALALILTPIILTGGIDLSVASVAVFSSVMVGFLWQSLGWPIGWAVVGGIVAGGLAGLSNALLVLLGVLPLVATLATRELYRGLALTISGDTPVSNFPPVLRSIWRDSILGLPVPLVALLVLLVIMYVIVHHTWIGRMLFAIGDNERSAKFAGVPTSRLKLGLYVASGFIAGVCGVALVMRFNAAAAENAETSLDLIAIACVVLGGTRITGGHGHIFGTMLGIITLVALQAVARSITSTWRETVLGVVLITVAVCNEAGARFSRSVESKPSQESV